VTHFYNYNPLSTIPPLPYSFRSGENNHTKILKYYKKVLLLVCRSCCAVYAAPLKPMFPTSASNEKRRASSPIRESTTSVSNASTLNSPPRRFSSPHQSPSTAPIHYSDRYIPSRSGSSLDNAFDLMTNSSNKSNTPQGDGNNNNNESGSENNSTRIMNTLIRAELLGERAGDGGGKSNSHQTPRRGGSGSSGGSPNVLR
jgi:hypothetical protein